MQPTTFPTKEIDVRRCRICCEPVTGIMCARCGHLHRTSDHPDFPAAVFFAKAYSAAVKHAAKTWSAEEVADLL